MARELPSTAVGRRRLRKLADLLEKDAKNKNGIKFNLRKWGVVEDPAAPVSCGTTACAMGLAALSGAFARVGLKAQIDPFGSVSFRVDHYWRTGEGAAMEVFHLQRDEAEWLFIPDYYPLRAPKTGAKGERFVAKRIRDFCAGRATP